MAKVTISTCEYPSWFAIRVDDRLVVPRIEQPGLERWLSSRNVPAGRIETSLAFLRDSSQTTFEAELSEHP